MKTSRKIAAAALCLLIPSVFAMEKLAESKVCLLRTADMQPSDKPFSCPLELAQRFGTIQRLLMNSGESQEISLPLSRSLLSAAFDITRIFESAPLHVHERQKALNKVFTRASVLKIAQIARVINYLDGPPELLMALLKLFASRFAPTRSDYLDILFSPSENFLKLLKDCFIRTTDMQPHAKPFPLFTVVAKKFVFLKNLLEDFSDAQLQTQEISVPFSLKVLTRAIELTALYESSDQQQKQKNVAHACSSLSVRELIELANALNYLDGHRLVLLAALDVLAGKLHAHRFEPGIIQLCQDLENMPPELQMHLNELFLIKYRNICTLTRIVRHFKISGLNEYDEIEVSQTGHFALLDTTLYDLRTSRISSLMQAFFPHGIVGNMSPDGKYLAAQGPQCTYVFDFKNERMRTINDVGIGYPHILNNRVLRIAHINGPSTDYDIESCTPDSSSQSDILKEALAKNNVSADDIECIRAQLTDQDGAKPLEIRKVWVSANQLAVMYYNHTIQYYDFCLFDISNPKKIVTLFFHNYVIWSAYDNEQFIVETVGARLMERDVYFVNAASPSQPYRVTLFGPSNEWARNDEEVDHEEFELYSRANKVLSPGYPFSSLNVVLENSHTATIPLPFRPGGAGTNKVWFSPTDDEYIIAKRTMLDDSRRVSICYLPLKRLKQCSFAHLIMLLHTLKQTPLVDDPYLKNLHETLPQDLKDLYFGSSKTHLETRTLERDEKIDCAVENEDIPELLTTDGEIKDQEKSNEESS